MSKEDLDSFDADGIVYLEPKILDPQFTQWRNTLMAKNTNPDNSNKVQLVNEDLFSSWLADLATPTATRLFHFPMVGKTKFRWLRLENEKIPYGTVKRQYQDQAPRTKYLIRAVIIPPVDATDPTPVARFLVVGKSVVVDMMTQGSEGFPLFEYEEGHGITLTRSGEGLMTKYGVVVSPKPVPMPKIDLGEVGTMSYEEASIKFDEFNEATKKKTETKKVAVELGEEATQDEF